MDARMLTREQRRRLEAVIRKRLIYYSAMLARMHALRWSEHCPVHQAFVRTYRAVQSIQRAIDKSEQRPLG